VAALTREKVLAVGVDEVEEVVDEEVIKSLKFMIK